MSFVGNLLGKIVGGITGANQAADAAKEAAATQSNSAQLGIDETRRQFDAMQQALAPYMTAGTGALTGQQDLLGLNGAPAQQTAISGIQASPQFQALQQQGTDAILANASATGGLRGGNVQASLAQFQPALLAQLIQQQYANLGGLTGLGQNAAAGVGNAGMATGANVANLLQQQGAATAGGQIADGSRVRQTFSDMLKVAGAAAGAGAFGSTGNPALANGTGYAAMNRAGQF